MISWMMILTWPQCTHLTDSSGSEGVTLEGAESLQNYSNGGETHNNHTNDTMPDETRPMTLTSASLSNPSPSNNNHTKDTIEDATTTSPYPSSSSDSI